jgi:hypothetical protein
MTLRLTQTRDANGTSVLRPNRTSHVNVQAMIEANFAGLYAWRLARERAVRFQGAMPAAEQAGFKRDTPEYRVFIAAYISGIEDTFGKRGVPVDAEGYVVAE